MKVLQNKETTLKNPDGETNAVYADLIAVALNAVPQGGISPSEMRKRLRIMKAVEAAPNANDLIKFEDNDADNLKGYVKTSRWGVIHEDILVFQDDVEGMKSE
jgi:hypothetical protein